MELEVLYEDNHLLVVNKPALMATMGVAPNEGSLVNVTRQYIKQKYNKPGNVYIGVVSRLDAFVSGVIVFARTSKAAARLNKQFGSQQTVKKYWAITPAINDLQPGQSMLLEHWVAKDEKKRRMMSVEEHSPGNPKQAKLKMRQIGEFENLALLEIELLTGRKHQIRVQMSAINKPIVGDRKYGSKLTFPNGIALHSYELSLVHPTKRENLTFSSPPPAYWNVQRFRRLVN